MKSTILCFNMVSEWKFVMRKEISYPCQYVHDVSDVRLGVQQGPTCIGFLRSTMKLSARCIMNLVN